MIEWKQETGSIIESRKEESGMSVIRKWVSAATAMAEVCFLLALSVAVAS